MIARRLAHVVSVLLGVTAAQVSTALPLRAEAQRAERVTITGCPYPGVTATCLMVKGAGGKVYNISAISPRPRALDRVIRIRGTLTDRLSACGEGVVLERIRWTRTRQRCGN